MMREFFPAHGSPCEKCGVRPDVSCAHREADPAYRPPVQDDVADRRSRHDGGQRLNFGKRQLISGGGLYAFGDVLRNRRRRSDAARSDRC